MRLSFRVLAAVVVVCALAAISRTPSAHALTPVPTPGATDRDVLVAFYHATDGDNWLRSDNWLTDAPIETWYGVTTDDSGRVIELVLWFNNLSGTVPPELGNLTALTRLDFSGNQLSGTIPTELGNLTALTYLRLSGNQLSGTVPPELGDLTALTRLDLDRNQLSGTVPPELGNLVNLDALYLAGNRLTGCQLAVWKHVEYNDLDQLGLPYCAAAADKDVLVALYHATDGDNWRDNDNWLSDAPTGTWYGVTINEGGRVVELDLWSNNLSGTIPPELGDLTALAILNLSDNDLSGTVPLELGNLGNLDTLYLANNRLTGCQLAVWEYVEYNDLDQLGLPYCAATADRDVLVALFWATDGDKWTNNDNWLSDAPLGTWYGVTTDENGRVIELSLGWNQLSGTVPAELGNLTALTNLYLGWNQLSGTIPPELGSLTALTYLGLSDNNLSGTVPPELGNLTALTDLYLGWNQLSGTIPPELANLTNLDKLYISGNQLSGCLPAVWEYVVENDLHWLDLPYCAAATPAHSAATDRDVLVALYLATDGDKWTANRNWLSDAPVGTWYGVTTDESGRVIELDLWHNDLSGTIPPELGNLTALTYLRLSGNDLSGTVPPELGNLTALTSLSLSSNDLSGAVPPELGNLTALTNLYLGWNQLSGTIPPELGNLTALTALNLSGNQLSGTIPPELGNLTSLDTLYLADNRLTGCQLAEWKYVKDNDVDQLGLPYCAAAADRDDLAALYWATDGDKWTNNDNWLSDAPLGTWYGVTADENGRVI